MKLQFLVIIATATMTLSEEKSENMESLAPNFRNTVSGIRTVAGDGLQYTALLHKDPTTIGIINPTTYHTAGGNPISNIVHEIGHVISGSTNGGYPHGHGGYPGGHGGYPNGHGVYPGGHGGYPSGHGGYPGGHGGYPGGHGGYPIGHGHGSVGSYPGGGYPSYCRQFCRSTQGRPYC